VQYWLAQAAANYESKVDPGDPNGWALVSWLAPVPGVPGSTPYQTFLVRVAVTPEPGFYGALALGMSGLALVVSRKRKSA
jgi:hypothetical protein